MTLSVDCSGAIGLGDDLTCTITNDDRDPQLATVVKVVNDNGSATASDWTMDITGANVSNTRFLGAETGVTVTLDPGVYNVGESGGPSGYAMSFSANCSGAIRLGDHLACNITNDDITPNVPTLTVTTNVVNDDGRSALASDWTVDITGGTVSSTGFAGSESGVTITVGAGVYGVSESGGPAGYALTHSDDCSGDIGLADVLTCIITANDEPAAFVPPSNALPTASIASPADESTFTSDFNIAFSGSGVDAEDGVLNGGSLRWTSSIDGEIGIGQSFTGSLAAGNHTITFTATDSQGALVSASFALTIKAPDAPGGSGGGGIAPDPTPQPPPQPIVIAQPTATPVPPTSTPAPTPTSQPPPNPTPTLRPPADTPTPTVTPQPTDLPAPTQVAPERSTPAPAAMPSPPNPTDGDGLSLGALTGIGSGVFAVLAASIFFGLWRSKRVSTAARSRTLWARARVGRMPR